MPSYTAVCDCRALLSCYKVLMQPARITHQLLRHARRSRACTVESQLHVRTFAAASSQLEAIKHLRESTSAPILDVKKALVEASWNVGVPRSDLMEAPQLMGISDALCLSNLLEYLPLSEASA